MKKSLLVSGVLLLILLLLLSLFANIRLILFSRATSTGSYSAENSYLFASPLVAKANNTDKIRVAVFLLDSQGKGVPNTEIRLNKSPNLVIEQVNSLTDSYGRAIFDLATNVSGQYPIEAIVNNTKIGEGITIRFE